MILGAENEVATLAVCFAIAAVIVAPFGYRRVRAVRRQRARLAPEPTAPIDAPADDRDLAAAVARLRAEAREHEPGATFEITLPESSTMGGRPADPTIVSSIVADSLRRDGIDVVARSGDTWHCRRR